MKYFPKVRRSMQPTERKKIGKRKDFKISLEHERLPQNIYRKSTYLGTRDLTWNTLKTAVHKQVNFYF